MLYAINLNVTRGMEHCDIYGEIVKIHCEIHSKIFL